MIQATFVEIPSIDSLPSTPVANQTSQSAVTPENKGFSDALQRQQQELSGGKKDVPTPAKTAVAPGSGQDDQIADDLEPVDIQPAIGNVSPAMTAAVAVNLPAEIVEKLLEPVLRPTVPTLVAKDVPSTAAGLVERSAVLAGQPLTTGTVKNLPGGGVAAAGEIDDIASSLTGQDRQLLSERGVKFVDTATARTNAVPSAPSAPAEAIQIKPTAVISGDPLPSVPTSFNSSLSVQELPTGNNGQMVDLIAGGARSEGASAGSVVGKSGLAPIDIPVNDPRWGAAVAQRVVMATKQGLQQAQITVTPANLGPIELQIQIQDDKASVTMISPHASVRELLEGATPRLRELFEQQGLTLQDSHVADQDSRGSQFADNESTDTETSLLDSDDLVSDEGGLVMRQSVGLVDRYA